ncbi:phosphatidylinositol N-acetylglucosaminyltransferase subunit P isoform X1 [Hydra vulgaris]|uniref:phosphatidylinositol N-acetylglucosaminyltransferase subunit P isoform X1 n=1 Tax=Hydra vulgaris TaxID=6087 RepID=UPI001F5F55B2|nr:phosphatidylinositol N-acetylglucosaminyltransferase subunit P isoform X1 [Hydra vulgaris]
MNDFDVPVLQHAPWPTPSRAIYGFVLYVLTYVIFGFYIIWALLPDSCLNYIGLTYLPSRHWVITFPFLCCTLVAIVYVGYNVNYWSNLPKFDDELEENST